jgi:hypothetical protein
MLKHPSAQPVVAQIKDFVTKFPNELPRAEASRRVAKFLSSTQDRMLSDCVVFAADADEEGRKNSAEGLEKFVLNRMHAKIFPSGEKDVEQDLFLRRRTASLQWVEFHHLGVPAVDSQLLRLAVEQLHLIDNYKAPMDKLICILNACRVINDVLKRTWAEGGESHRPLSADDFLPLLIYTLLKANPPRMHSNLEFVAAYRHPTRLVAEEAYFLTALQSACAFVKDAGPSSLEVPQEEYDSLCRDALAVFEGVDAKATRVTEPTNVVERASTLGPLARRRIKARLGEFLRFEHIESGSQLTVADVSDLLEEYKQLVHLLREVDSGALEE